MMKQRGEQRDGQRAMMVMMMKEEDDAELSGLLLKLSHASVRPGGSDL